MGGWRLPGYCDMGWLAITGVLRHEVVGDYRAHALLRVVGHRSYRSNRSYRYWGAVLEDTGLRLGVAWLGCGAITEGGRLRHRVVVEVAITGAAIERGLAGVWGDCLGAAVISPQTRGWRRLPEPACRLRSVEARGSDVIACQILYDLFDLYDL